jgi:hypothetical protein
LPGKSEAFEESFAVILVIVLVKLIVIAPDAILTPVFGHVANFSLVVYARGSFGDRFISVFIALIGVWLPEPHQRVEIKEAVAGFGVFTSAALRNRIADVEHGSEFDAVPGVGDGRD